MDEVKGVRFNDGYQPSNWQQGGSKDVSGYQPSSSIIEHGYQPAASTAVQSGQSVPPTGGATIIKPTK